MAAQGVFHWMQASLLLQLCLSEVLLPEASQTSRTYYETLNVGPTATDIQIKKNFRQLAVKYHPDKNKSADAEKTFREIAEAYQVLSNKEKRRLYDNVGHEAFLKNEASGESEHEHDTAFHFTFADFFHDFDDSPFAEDPDFFWSFPPVGDDEGGSHEHHSFEDPGFTFYFGDEYEDEENFHH